jgi:hypothetical protein
MSLFIKPGYITKSAPKNPPKQITASILVRDHCNKNQAILHTWSIPQSEWIVDSTTTNFLSLSDGKLYQYTLADGWKCSQYSGLMFFECYVFRFECGLLKGEAHLCSEPLTQFFTYQTTPVGNISVNLRAPLASITVSPYSDVPLSALIATSNPEIVNISSASLPNNYMVLRYSFIDDNNIIIQVQDVFIQQPVL